uniref:Uncharacterized protein n=2 Tax=Arion vulgaris TaxID=1028688 RepID=A0A0B6Z7T1_9EUPU
MKHEYAWQWHELKEQLLEIPNVPERQKQLLEKHTLAMLELPKMDHRVHDFKERVNALIDEASPVLKLNPLNNHPSVLQFRKYVTKTAILKWEQTKPKVFDSMDTAIVDEEVKNLKKHICDHMHMEYDIIERVDMSPSKQRVYLCKSLIRCISDTLVLELGKHLNHLRTCHYDEDVIVRALWSRHGIERKKRLYTYDLDKPKFITVEDQPIISEGLFDGMVRSHLPLPEFQSGLSKDIVDCESSQFKYKPSAFGEDKPGHSLLKSISAGHRFGDPCEYGLIGFLSTCNTHETEKIYGSRVARDCRLSMGLTNTFTWLTAQACNQGFSHVIDLTYPLTSQTIMTDGEKFSFLAYQLNTLELWKDDIGNNKVNLCWCTDEMSLYHSIEHGKVRELNDDVLTLLVKMFMLPPTPRAHDMKPTISKPDISLHLKNNFVPERVIIPEVIVEEQYIVS